MWRSHYTEHHTFFFSLIPLFIIAGFIRKGTIIDVIIQNTFLQLKNTIGVTFWSFLLV